MSEIIDKIVPYIPESLKEIDIHKAIRLTVIVGGYILIRNVTQKYLANRQLENQLKQDTERKEQERIEDLVDDPNAKASGLDDGSWGWGKKTRRNVKRQEKILQEQIENLQNGQALDEDKDIEDLLED